MRYKLFYAAVGLALAAMTSCNSQWDGHYEDSDTTKQSLWEAINDNEDLQPFATLLSQYGYDKSLSTHQRFTVWAPKGPLSTTLLTGATMSADEIQEQILENHIARSVFSVSSLTNDTVLVLNGKAMPFVVTDEVAHFNGAAVVAANVECANGMLHIIEGQAQFNHNIWTYLRQAGDLQSLADYMYSFNRQVLDTDASTVGGVAGGEKYYSDSVFVTSNDLWSDIGNLSDENKDFLLLAPCNDTWRQKVDEVAALYHYPSAADSAKGLSYARKNIVVNLVADKNSSKATPAYFSQNISERVACSNGEVRKTQDLAIDPYETIAQPIVIEAEQETMYQTAKSNCADDDLAVTMKAADVTVSAGAFLPLTASSAILKPSVTYALPNVLSCKYDIGVVLVPQNMTAYGYSSTIDQKKSRLNFELKDGNTGKTETFNQLVYDGTKVDTLWITRDHVFDYCDYYPDGIDKTKCKVTLKITNDARRSETSTFTRNIYIDCIVLKPHK
jgi:uncharacterized surface protein with fasciclin (FAS1) repeats